MVLPNRPTLGRVALALKHFLSLTGLGAGFIFWPIVFKFSGFSVFSEKIWPKTGEKFVGFVKAGLTVFDASGFVTTTVCLSKNASRVALFWEATHARIVLR